MKLRKEFSRQDLGIEKEWYWGMAYRDYMRDAIVAYIIPLNWIVWAAREIWIRLINTPQGIVDKAYQKGWDDMLNVSLKLADKEND